MQHRVALARALAMEPEIQRMDEMNFLAFIGSGYSGIVDNFDTVYSDWLFSRRKVGV